MCRCRRPMHSKTSRCRPWRGSSRPLDPTSEEISLTKKVAVLGTRYPDLSIEEGILEPLGAEIVVGDGATPDAIVEQAADAEVILAGSRPRFDAATLERLHARAIVRYGVGTETIDLPAASEMGMWVAYVPDFGTEAVSVHALTLALAARGRVNRAEPRLREGGWGFGDN